MAVQVTFDITDRDDRDAIRDLLDSYPASLHETNLVCVDASGALCPMPASTAEPELTDEVMRAAFKECYQRVGQEKAFAILHEYGEKLDKVDKTKYPELFKKWSEA